MKEDEIWLLSKLYEEHRKMKPFKLEDFGKPLNHKTAREIIENQNAYNHKRLWYVMNKFDNKGLVDYGTSLGTAWLTDKGIERAKELCK